MEKLPARGFDGGAVVVIVYGASALWIVVAALAIDALVGDPQRVWQSVSHPVVLIGRVIEVLEGFLNEMRWSSTIRRVTGAGAVLLVIVCSIVAGIAIEALARLFQFGELPLALFGSVLLSQRSLYAHVRRVQHAFTSEGLVGARATVASIVARDPGSLDRAGVSRAPIESCAKNFSDGVVAPTFWFALFGLPELLAYKAVNAADSMLGHRAPRYLAFGWAAARLDDLLNLVPARASGLLLALTGGPGAGSPLRNIRIMARDARLHRSPNAGWPESAMAASLGLTLAGPSALCG